MQPSAHDVEPTVGIRDRVLAVLVVHGEQPWQDVVASRLAARAGDPDTPRLLIVDNGGPGAERFAQATGADLLRMERPTGYGRAVAAAAAHELAADAEFLLLLHDDLVLDSGAILQMVAVMDRRDEVAVTGPKLLDWRREPTLQQVGMTIDAFGRAESHLLDGEVDQGQRDHRDRTLYVSTAGMLVRRAVFTELGGFDPRFAALRDDLDLCWRAWLAGHTVEVVPEAVGWHVAAAGRSVRRRGVGRHARTRFLAERHTLASMLKNLGWFRLLWVLPVYVVLAVAKAVGFLLTRRAASATVPFLAIAWNVRVLPGTLHLRRTAQRSRRRSDAEVSKLFAQGRWRTRAYVEALRDWFSGEGTRSLVGDDDRPRPAGGQVAAGGELRRSLRRHPALLGGTVLLAVWVVACLPLLGSGPIVGGQVLPWPEDVGDLLAAYTSGWGPGPLASGAFPSPVAPLVWLVSVLVGGVAWVAQRVVVLGLVPLTWLVALRAGRLVTSRPGPRVLGATLYVTSPLVLGAFGEGRLDVLAVALALPGVLLLVARATRPGVSPGAAWRATALLAVVVALAVAAAPPAWPVLVLPGLGIALVAGGQQAVPTVLARLSVAALGATGLLLPWLVDLGAGLPAVTPEPLRPAMWEAMTGRITLLPEAAGLLGGFWVAAAVITVIGALLFALPRRGGTVVVLLGAVVAFGFATALASHQPDPVVWPPLVSLPATLALSGLAVTAARGVSAALAAPARRRGAMALRRTVAAVGAVTLLAGPAAMAVAVVDGGWSTLRRAPESVPLFVRADTERVGPYRVLLLSGDDDAVSWDVTEAEGRTMAEYGHRRDPALAAALEDTVAGLLSGDPRAAGRAGLLGVRYLVLRDEATRAAVAPALSELAAVEPTAAGSGRVYQLRTWLPGAAVVDPDWITTALAGQPLPTDAVESRALSRLGIGRYGGGPVGEGVLAVAEASDDSWVAEAGGRPLVPSGSPAPGVPTMLFGVDDATQRLVVDAAPADRGWWLAFQAFVLLVLLSLALRAPGRPLGAAQIGPGVLPERARSEVPVPLAGRTRETSP